MPRGYRSVFITLAGLALLGSSPSDSPAQPEDGRTGNDPGRALTEIGASPKETSKAVEPDTGCKPGEDNRRSDLCAQWKAADAAAESANWTRRAFWIGVGGLAVGFLTLIAAAFAAWYARKAAQHTRDSVTEAKRSADAAEETLATTIEAFDAQMRPYVAITTENDDEPGTPFSRDTILQIIVKNFGQIPATNVRLSLGEAFRPRPIGNFVVPIDEKFGDYGLIAPGDHRTEKIHTKALLPSQIASLAEGNLKLLVRVRIDYIWSGGDDFHDITMILGDPSVNEWHVLDERTRGIVS